MFLLLLMCFAVGFVAFGVFCCCFVIFVVFVVVDGDGKCDE